MFTSVQFGHLRLFLNENAHVSKLCVVNSSHFTIFLFSWPHLMFQNGPSTRPLVENHRFVKFTVGVWCLVLNKEVKFS